MKGVSNIYFPPKKLSIKEKNREKKSKEKERPSSICICLQQKSAYITVDGSKRDSDKSKL